MTLKIRYQNFEKPENEQYVAAIVEKYRALLPRWLDRLTIVIYDNNEDAPEDRIAWNRAVPEYGYAHINIHSKWLDKDADLQDELILHEILHVAHGRERNFICDRLLDPVQDRNKELYSFLCGDYRERNEEFINCLAQNIQTLLKEAKGD